MFIGAKNHFLSVCRPRQLCRTRGEKVGDYTLQAAHPIRSWQRKWIDFFFSLNIWLDDQQTHLGGLSPPMPLANTCHNCKFNLELMQFNVKNISQDKHILGDFSFFLLSCTNPERHIFLVLKNGWNIPAPCCYGCLAYEVSDSTVRHVVAHKISVCWCVTLLRCLEDLNCWLSDQNSAFLRL